MCTHVLHCGLIICTVPLLPYCDMYCTVYNTVPHPALYCTVPTSVLSCLLPCGISPCIVLHCTVQCTVLYCSVIRTVPYCVLPVPNIYCGILCPILYCTAPVLCPYCSIRWTGMLWCAEPSRAGTWSAAFALDPWGGGVTRVREGGRAAGCALIITTTLTPGLAPQP